MPRNWQNDTRKMVRDEKAKLAGFSKKPGQAGTGPQDHLAPKKPKRTKRRKKR
ncbi:MAG TPA: hypothetical protein VFH37_03020 [Candidatus Saccharimonadales bacterium]|nr:hypothetical protein [Candidatus Saccharimonadales bacterium]